MHQQPKLYLRRLILLE